MSSDGPAPARAIIYCIVPMELAEWLFTPLRRHFEDHPEIEVIVEQRGRERRRRPERRTAAEPRSPDRRRVLSASGRRVADRRATAVEIEAPAELPRRLRRHAPSIVFREILPAPAQLLEDRDTSRLVVRIQGGEHALFADLYVRYFDRVFGYLRVVLKDTHEAEDVAQHAFIEIFEALPRYERRRQPFRAWMFTIVRNAAVSHLRRHHRLDVVAPAEVDRRRERVDLDDGGLNRVLQWVSDNDVLLFIERLPLAQRQVLTLRFMAGMTSDEIATVLGRTPEAVRMQQSRALTFLRERLKAVGREPRRSGRQGSRTVGSQMRVVRIRRFSLVSKGPTG